MSESKSSAYRTGFYVFVGLLVLTAVEYVVGTAANPSAVALLIIALVKAVLIIYFFMHVYRLWREESH